MKDLTPSFTIAENLYMAAGLEQMIEAESDMGFNKDELLKRTFRLNVLN